jgi:hypothetical protein
MTHNHAFHLQRDVNVPGMMIHCKLVSKKIIYSDSMNGIRAQRPDHG